MSKSKKVKKHIDIGNILFKIFFGFLIPFLVINGIILFLFIQMPKITVIDSDSKDYEESKIKFTIECLLPVTNIQTFFQENEVPYTKSGNYYSIDATENGTYQIKVTAINKAMVNSYVEIETRDSDAPVINLNDATIISNTLTFTVHDDQSGINYDNIYATDEDGTSVSPIYVDKASGTVQFKIETNKKLTIHVEDELGNSSETTFTAS